MGAVHRLISEWFHQQKSSLLHLLSLAHNTIYYTSPPYLTSLLTLKTPTNFLTLKYRHFPNLPSCLIPEIP